METPFTWFVIRYQAPAGRSPILLAGAIVTLLLAMSIVTALVPRTGPTAGATDSDRSHDQVEEARLQFGVRPKAAHLDIR
jgi:hypothetical protein